jgi:hypothetical protein
MSEQYAEMAGLDPQTVIFTRDRKAAEVVLKHLPQVNTDAVHVAAEALRELGMVAGAEAKFPRGGTQIVVTFRGDARGGGLTDREVDRFMEIVGPRYKGTVDAKIVVYRAFMLRYGQAIVLTTRYDRDGAIFDDANFAEIAEVPGVMEEPIQLGERLIIKIDPSLVDEEKIITIARAVAETLGVYLAPDIENTDKEVEGDLWSQELLLAIKLLQEDINAVHPADSDEPSEDADEDEGVDHH